jgi:hypothetical protein
LPYILENEYQEMYSRYLEDSELVKAGVLARQPIQQLLQEHLGGRVDHGNRLWLPKENFRDGANHSEIATAA